MSETANWKLIALGGILIVAVIVLIVVFVFCRRDDD